MSAPVHLTVHRLVPVEVTLLPADVLPHLPGNALRAECVRRGLLPDDEAPAISGGHIRAARALLGWSMDRLAAEACVSTSTVKRLEDGGAGATRPANVDAVLSALRRGGARFRRVGDATGVLTAAPTPIAQPGDTRVPA